MTLFLIATVYPLLCLISSAISDPAAVYTGRVTFYPIGFSLRGFEINLQNAKVLIGFYNTLIYTVSGTALSLAVTLLTAFALSRHELIGRSAISLFFAFTMWFSGGLIPFYLLVRDLGMYNTRWALIVPGVVNVWNVIVCRTNINSTIPEEMYEAASIDGGGYFRFFLRMVVPLSKPIIAVIVLWTAIGHWNSYFNALIFILDNDKKPLQLYLAGISRFQQRGRPFQRRFRYGEPGHPRIGEEFADFAFRAAAVDFLSLHPEVFRQGRDGWRGEGLGCKAKMQRRGTLENREEHP